LPWLHRPLFAVPRFPTYQAALETGLALALLAEVVALVVHGGTWSTRLQAALWTQVVLTLAAARGLGLFRVFGPVLVYDLIRTARRNRYFLIRVLYASFLGLTLGWTYFTNFQSYSGRELSVRQMAEFGAQFFFTFLTVQFLLIAVLTPGYVAGAVAEEKERRTIEFLLATDLRNREIVLSKLASRLLNLTMLVLIGLPILGLLQFMGGVDPGLLLAAFAATGLTMLGLSGLSLLNSVLARRARDAILMTYLQAAGYVILSGFANLLLLVPGWATFPSTFTWTSPVTLQDAVEAFNAGNPITVLIRMTTEVARGGRVDLVVPALLRDYALFHGLLALVCCTWAVLRLRALALNTAGEKSSRVGRRWLTRPRVSDQPMLWKELHVEHGPRLHWLARGIILLLIVASFVPVGFIVYFCLRDRGYAGIWTPWGMLAESMNIWVRTVGTAVATLLLVAVAVRAAASVSGERDKQTFDELLTTPLTSESILSAKWMGSLLAVRKGWLWLGCIAALGIVTAGLHPVAALLLVAAWFIYAAFLACLGLWCSTVCKTSLRATTWTLFFTVAAACGHWLIWMVCLPLLGPHGDGSGLDVLLKLQAGITPPIALAFLAFPLVEPAHSRDSELVAYAALGLVFWLVVTLVFWNALSVRFREATNRVPLLRRRPPASWNPPRPLAAPVGQPANDAPNGASLPADAAEVVDVVPEEPSAPGGEST
jgi:ABC-type transport system involved in multi-copper enzyme maturation permease subunit